MMFTLFIRIFYTRFKATATQANHGLFVPNVLLPTDECGYKDRTKFITEIAGASFFTGLPFFNVHQFAIQRLRDGSVKRNRFEKVPSCLVLSV